jgi:hypothetical protein
MAGRLTSTPGSGWGVSSKIPAGRSPFAGIVRIRLWGSLSASRPTGFSAFPPPTRLPGLSGGPAPSRVSQATSALPSVPSPYRVQGPGSAGLKPATAPPVDGQPYPSLRGLAVYRTGSLEQSRQLVEGTRPCGPGGWPGNHDVVLPARHDEPARPRCHAALSTVPGPSGSMRAHPTQRAPRIQARRNRRSPKHAPDPGTLPIHRAGPGRR